MREMSRLCVAHRLKRAARAVSRLYDELLTDVGVTSSQLTLICALEARPDLNMAGLAELLAIEQSALSRAIGALERRKLVTVSRGKDQRQRVVCLTPSARTLAKRAATRWREAQRIADAHIDDRTQLFGALDRLADVGRARARA